MGTWQDPQVWAWSAPALLEDLSGREGNYTYFETCELSLMVLYNSLHILRMLLSSF